jgi:phage terminase large subunit-like protein
MATLRDRGLRVGEDGSRRVLADCSVRRPTTRALGARGGRGGARVAADRVVAEANNGGEMVRSVLHAADIALPLRLVALPAAARRRGPSRWRQLYEGGQGAALRAVPAARGRAVRADGRRGLRGAGALARPADALVWALSELMLARRAEPRVRVL